MNKVAIYARVSTSHHDQNPDIQVQALTLYCASRGWTVTEVIVDYASGGTDRREGLQRLLKLIDAGKIDCVVVTKLDRLFRSLRQLVTALDDFQAKGVAFVAVKDSVDYSSAAGKMFTQILGSLAEFERSLVRERTIAGLHYARTVKGKKLGRPSTADRALVKALIAQGLPYREIAKLARCSHWLIRDVIKTKCSEADVSVRPA